MLRRLGPYHLLRQVAVGGMAEIYLASVKGEDGGERRVALKLIHRSNADDPDLIAMLVAEAKLALQLHHPNIVATYDLGQEGGEYYIVMELVEGMDLFRALQRAADRDIDFPFELAAFIAREVAVGLDYAHRRLDDRGQALHVVHRDVSPHNVLLSYGGEVKLGDFGIAKVARRATQTQAGVIKGKYAYMSPEQAWGDPIDARTDIFSAGILLYEMLAGQMLYLDEDLELLELVRKAEIAPPGTRRKGVPRDLEQIVMKALRKRPSDRWPTAGDYAQGLTDFLRGYAPSCNAQHELGLLLAKLAGPQAPAGRRDPKEPTATMAQPRMFSGSAIGVRDENSLLFPVPRRAVPTTEEKGEEDPFGGETYIDEGPAALLGLAQELGHGDAPARDDADEDREPTTLMPDPKIHAVPPPLRRPSGPPPPPPRRSSAPPAPPPPRRSSAPPAPPPAEKAPPPAEEPPPPAEKAPPPPSTPPRTPSSGVAPAMAPELVPPPMPARPAPPAVAAPVAVRDQPRAHGVSAMASGGATPPPEAYQLRPRRGGMVLAFLLAMAVGAGVVLSMVLWPRTPDLGQLEISSTPPGALVLINGRPVAMPTPVRVMALDAGETHRITLRLSGHRTFETEVRFAPTEKSRAVQATLDRE